MSQPLAWRWLIKRHSCPPSIFGMFTPITTTALPTGELDASGSPEHRLVQRFRQKQSQAARACDGCRTRRTKCDNNRPCSNCKYRGRHCSNNNGTKVSTLSQVYGEIGHLRQKVEELEVKLKQERQRTVNLDQHLPTPYSLPLPQAFQAGNNGPDHGY